MNYLKAVQRLFESKALTIWLVGMFLLYYLTVAVWSKEAFASFIALLSTNNIFRSAYAVFFLNVVLRGLKTLKVLWPDRARFFLRLPLYIGTVIFLFSFAMSLNIRQSKWLLVGEGDVPEIPWEQTDLQVAHVTSALEKKALRTEGSAIFDYEPSVTLLDRNGARYDVGAFPPRLVHSTFMHVLNFGIGPGLELKKDSKSVWQGEMALRLTPFGNTDSFEIAPFPYKFYLSILPNRLIKKGKESARDYDLEKPRYRIEIEKGETIIARAETDTAIAFDGDMSLGFSPPSNWVILDVVYDPFLPFFVAGLLVMGVGIILYSLSYVRFGKLGSRP